MSFNTTKTTTLPADGTPMPVNLFFTFFMVRAASADFEMSLDGQDWFPMAQGESFGPLEQPVQKVYFRAINGVGQDITYRCSNVLNANSRLNIIHDANQILSVGSKIPPTYLKATNQVIASGGNLMVPGVDAGNQRKDIIITNLDAVGLLTIQTVAGQTGGVVWPQDNLPLETSDTVKILNQTGAGISVLVLEVYYAA